MTVGLLVTAIFAIWMASPSETDKASNINDIACRPV